MVVAIAAVLVPCADQLPDWLLVFPGFWDCFLAAYHPSLDRHRFRLALIQKCEDRAEVYVARFCEFEQTF